MVGVLCIAYASLCLSQNTTMFSWFPTEQEDSAPDQEAALVRSGYDDTPFDQKHKPAQGGFGDFSSIEILALFRPIVTIQERVFQKIFSTSKSLSESEKFMWLPAVRTLIVGWREQTHYHAESPVFTQEEEIVANTQSEIVIYEVPVSKSDSEKEKKTDAAEASSEGKNTGASNLSYKPESTKKKQEHEDEQPHEENPEHNCDGSNCAACNFEPCHCQSCLVKLKPLSFSPSSEKQDTRDAAEERAINNQTRCRHILDIDDMNVVKALPDGTLVVMSRERYDLPSGGVLATQQIKHWKTIEVSLPIETRVVFIDSSQFILESIDLSTHYSNQDGSWVRVELGTPFDVALLSDGRFVTAPPLDDVSSGHRRLAGDYQVWSMQEDQLVAIPLGPGDKAKEPLVLGKSNRIVTFHDNGLVKVWIEENLVWTVSILSENEESYQNVGTFTEFDDGRLLSAGKTLGIWSQVAGNWVYSELLNEQFFRMGAGLILLDNKRFVTYQGESRSLKLWVNLGDTWVFEELIHQHNERIKIQSINERQFITWSYDSAKIWTCQESCSFIKLTDENDIQYFKVLAANRVISWNHRGDIQLWCEHNSHWSNESFNRLSRYNMGIDRVVQLPQGYLAVTHSGVYGFLVPTRSFYTSFWHLSPIVSEQESQLVGEHLQRVEHDTTVEYKPWENPLEGILPHD